MLGRKEVFPLKTGLIASYDLCRPADLLRAAALQRAVETLGGECELIDYRPAKGGGAQPACAGSRRRERRDKPQGNFAGQHLRMSAHRFESLEELRAAELPYGLLLCGGQRGGAPDPAFFGAFSRCRKAAYALDLGAERIPEEAEGWLRDCLGAFSHISAGAGRGREMIRALAGRSAPAALDPILLLPRRDWIAMAERHGKPESGYILCDCDGGVLEAYVRRLADETGLQTVQLRDGERKIHPRAKRVQNAGPAELLGWFQSASLVCTGSFAGTALAILFQKPFFTAVSAGDFRTRELLSRLGLTDRIAGEGAAGLPGEIDWAGVEARLEPIRQDSLARLDAALRNGAEPAEKPLAEAGGRLAERVRCTGCTACASVCPRNAISMERDGEGFAYPAVDRERCALCGRCAAVCPVLHPREKPALPAAFAAWNRQDAVRRDSTAGGVFTALAEFVLESGGVVFGAVFDGKQHLRHEACFDKKTLWRLRGTKYVQSDLDGVFRMVRECLAARQVLFSGTPCQVDGLYRFLGGRPENLTTCDLICRGVPSPGVWEDMARSLERRKGQELQAVRFCNKVPGWQESHFTAVFDSGTVDSAPLGRTEYGRACSRALLLRPSCYGCPYASVSRPGDFTLGRLLGLRPEELPEQREKGVSLLLVNTAHGSHIFDQLPLERQACAVERAIAGNPGLSLPAVEPPERAAFFASYALEPFESVRRRFLSLPPLPVRAAERLLPAAEASVRRRLGRRKDG